MKHFNVLTSPSGAQSTPLMGYSKLGFLTQHRCFHQPVLSLVHIINLSNIHPLRARFYWKPRVFDENTGVGFKTWVQVLWINASDISRAFFFTFSSRTVSDFFSQINRNKTEKNKYIFFFLEFYSTYLLLILHWSGYHFDYNWFS